MCASSFQAKISLKRLAAFLNLEELNPESSKRNTSDCGELLCYYCCLTGGIVHCSASAMMSAIVERENYLPLTIILFLRPGNF